MNPLMKLILAVPVIMLFLVAVKCILILNKLKDSKYTKITGNGLMNLVFNKGNYGEFLTFLILEKLNIKYILANVYIKKQNQKTTEIDLLTVTKKGIFVYESKNYSGWIFGDEQNQNWTQSLNSKTKNKFYNPIFQNKGHIKALSEYLGIDAQHFKSYIIFSERCELKKVTVQSKDIKAIKRNELEKIQTQDLEMLPDILSDDQLIKIYYQLKACCLVNETVKREHINQVKSMKG